MPIELSPNQPANRFYRGGERIARLREGNDPLSAPTHSVLRTPEDWVASTTTLAGENLLGLSSLPGGQLLRTAINADPSYWLGSAHLEQFGVDTKLLTKLLDAGQRLPVHAHPHSSFANEHLGRAHGKAEAWFILTPGTVYLGLREDISVTQLAHWVAAQNTRALLSALNSFQVIPGDVVYVPPGVLHATGSGILLIEIQEPEDLSILLEWDGFALDGARDGHLGLGFDLALTAVDHRNLTAIRLNNLVTSKIGSGSLLPAEADEYFRIERVQVIETAELEPSFAVIVVKSGSICFESTHSVPWSVGSVLLTAFGEGRLNIFGTGELIVCRPPTVH